MSLRSRLVVAIIGLTAVALALFGFAVTSAYRQSQERALDEQLVSSVGPIFGRLTATVPTGEQLTPQPAPQPGRAQPPLAIPAGYVAELRGAGDVVIATLEQDTATSSPDLAGVSGEVNARRFSTVGSAVGTGEWRVLVEPAVGTRMTVVIAVPLSGLTNSVNRLVLLQTFGGLILLGVLALGSTLVVRRGLRPLEHMADDTLAITSGNLERRVAPADGRTEVGQLGRALNTMLDGIQGAFAARDATEATLRRFLADASHELRTPLTSIQGFAELGRIGTPDEIDPQLAFTRIESEAARMRRLVDDLLLLARLDEHRPLRLQSVDLAVIAADAATDARRATAPDRPMTVDAPDPAVVVGDADLLRQAIGNLVANALRHTPVGSAIEIATRNDAGTIVVTIRDHGPGFPSDQLDRVFDRFWQADRARVGEGSGLGLAIVAAITAEHHGTAEATNHPEGGAVVTLRFPLNRTVDDDEVGARSTALPRVL